MKALMYSEDEVGLLVQREVMAERERCARIAESVYLHTTSMTLERDIANRICPRIAKAIRAGGQLPLNDR